MSYIPNTEKQTAKDYTYYYSKLRRHALQFALDQGHIVLPEHIIDEKFNLSIAKKIADYFVIYFHNNEKFYLSRAKHDFKKSVDLQHSELKNPEFPWEQWLNRL